MAMKIYLACLASLLAAALGCSSSSQPAPTSRVESTREVSTVATVQSVDQENREITLKGPRGNVVTCKVDERVKNLSRINPGDRVAVTYTEALAVQVVKKGEGQEDQALITEQSPEGERPKGTAVRSVSLTADVVSVDQKNGSITLRDRQGDVQTFFVRHPERLTGVKAGDTLWIRYTEGLAISVEPTQAEAK
jgi:hypothetical protein